MQGKKGKYFLSNYGDVDTPPVIASGNSEHRLALKFQNDYQADIDVQIAGDSIKPVVRG